MGLRPKTQGSGLVADQDASGWLVIAAKRCCHTCPNQSRFCQRHHFKEYVVIQKVMAMNNVDGLKHVHQMWFASCADWCLRTGKKIKKKPRFAGNIQTVRL